MSKHTFHITGGKQELYDIMTSVQSAPEPVFLLDYFAEWCGPCKAISPTLDTLTASHAKQRSLYLFKIDVDEPGNDDLVSMFKVKSMPTLVWLIDGQTYARVEGADKNRIIETTNAARSS